MALAYRVNTCHRNKHAGCLLRLAFATSAQGWIRKKMEEGFLFALMVNCCWEGPDVAAGRARLCGSVRLVRIQPNREDFRGVIFAIATRITPSLRFTRIITCLI